VPRPRARYARAARYSGDWTDDALNGLAAAWNAAADRSAVTFASHRLDLDLLRGPYRRGVARNSSVNRTAVDLPLGVDYEIIEDDKTVRVVHVWSMV
jgi:hypothetical protein